MNAPLKTDLTKRVEQYIALRDKIKELNDAHKEKMRPYNETLEQLNSALLMELDKINGDSVRTEAGTVYRTTKKSASIADASAFWAHIVVNNDWELLDKRANSVAVEEYIKSNGCPPPGVNFTQTHVVGVRRS